MVIKLIIKLIIYLIIDDDDDDEHCLTYLFCFIDLSHHKQSQELDGHLRQIQQRLLRQSVDGSGLQLLRAWRRPQEGRILDD